MPLPFPPALTNTQHLPKHRQQQQTVLCLGALSNWSLFLIPLRDPSFIGGMLHGFKKAKQNISDRIVEIPLRSIVDVALVSGRERLQTFRSFQANSVSRPFRIATTKKLPPDGEMAVLAAAAARKSGRTFEEEQEEEMQHFLLVGFEDVSRLRHFLVLACESWAIRTGGAFGGPAKELLSCSPVAAQRYLAGVFEAMTGSLRNQVLSEDKPLPACFGLTFRRWMAWFRCFW